MIFEAWAIIMLWLQKTKNGIPSFSWVDQFEGEPVELFGKRPDKIKVKHQKGCKYRKIDFT